MDKNTLIFIVLCIVIVVSVLGVYTYNENAYRTQSTMVVMSDVDNLNTQVEYAISNVETTVTIQSTSVVIVSTIPTIITSETENDITTTITTTTTTQKVTTTKDTELVVNFPISLNTATLEQLVCIKGIGEVTAQKIIDYRNSIGGYTSRYQLLEINGIGESKMNTIMEYTYIENEILDYGLDNNSQQEYSPSNDYQAQPYAETQIDYEIYAENTQTIIEFPIDLNTATLEELCCIPNVNETIAQKILDLRDTIQYYSNPYELLYIDDISESFLAEIIQYVCVQQ